MLPLHISGELELENLVPKNPDGSVKFLFAAHVFVALDRLH